jgi:HEPN domain-containing protein
MAPAETPTGFLRIAARDLRTARAMADPSVFEEDSWGFSIQQATEKALKAWLLPRLPEQPPFTHNLRLLFQMLLDQGIASRFTSKQQQFLDFVLTKQPVGRRPVCQGLPKGQGVAQQCLHTRPLRALPTRLLSLT